MDIVTTKENITFVKQYLGGKYWKQVEGKV